MHVLDEKPHILDRGLGENAVAEVEDVPWATGCLLQDRLGARRDLFLSRKKNYRIEVPLHSAAMGEHPPTAIERNAPVESDDVGIRLLHEWKQGRRVCAEINYRNTGTPQ